MIKVESEVYFMSNNTLLDIKNLHSSVEEKEILKGVDLTVKKGEIHVIMGPNGAGKSTLAYTLMGHPKYEVSEGEASIDGEDILEMSVDERAKAGLFLSFQYPEVINGITVENMLRTAKNTVTGKNQSVLLFKKELNQAMESLSIDKSSANRYLNVGFSGGEKKKNEILQMKVLNPKVAILDETDSGLDVDAIKIVSEGVKAFSNDENAVIIITHYNKLLDYVDPDYVHILKDGKIIKTGDKSLAHKIDESGFASI